MTKFLEVIIALGAGCLSVIASYTITSFMNEDTVLRDIVGVVTFAIIFIIAGFIMDFISKHN